MAIAPNLPSSQRKFTIQIAKAIVDLLRNYGSLLVLLLVWEIVARMQIVSPYMLPSFSDVLARFWTELGDGTFPENLLETMRRALLGFGIAVVVGVAIGFIIARNATANWLLTPLISLGFPLPKITFMPIFILWLGVYDSSKVLMIVCDAIFPVITSTVAGIQGMDRYLIWSARNLGAREHHLWYTAILPAAAPQILSGIEVALPIALIIAVITEMMLGGAGLGGSMMEAWRFADSVGVFAGLFELSVVGLLLIQIMSAVRRRVLRWHPETQTGLMS
ncbi:MULTISPECIES: ABC transporter permease [unclassified Beijerinckia]|uniref:ABC transporter permease n=1 Tax=unclassified Beijerinckia TaxID=2638183 RepID=UPI00089CD156|nr:MULTISPECIES: ABC transporter permease [unclassified Beijerinckia]MDH7799209.1 ABC-type nitrate/sulfonate/bicarbonate transport system permease component [Beijerinckia sp. GAS462]SED91899.1 NitT/TauT family transport system permease protein/taurine transport system permease protein [Beijerinckia sp. 28-YEA-48]